MLIMFTPVEGSGKLGSWDGQNIPRICANFADGFQHPMSAENILSSAGGPTVLCARSAPAGRPGSTVGGMFLNVSSADGRRLRFRNGFWAAYPVATLTPGISAMQLQHRFRKEMVYAGKGVPNTEID